ncbi:hypothetical protein MLD38_002889 [Melastoma candidum]|uniref:Uncharacterized protein n=1 Tax=Melastoma candidum TaxID=119954 RepID=A0ACB9S3X8_9MYRT|nr:hypothetical protein MLD38_002889 [Melastoma candidum]
MDKSAQNKVQPVVKKVKKKQGKDELDRLKQAEKKKRRLEKALATSAAIRTELELKKLKKKEEQQRLDEEGAAIAEAVALRVLVGEDSDELCDLALSADHGYGPWFHDGHFDFPVAVRRASLANQDCRRNSLERVGWTPSAEQPGLDSAGIARGDWALYRENCDIYGQLIDNGGWGTTDLSPGLIAAQAVSSLQIRDNGHVDRVYY